MPDLFTQLDHDWHTNHAHLPAPPGPITVPEPGRLTVDELVQLANGRGDPAASDAILAGLAGRAAHDDLAARALLQAILPGLKALAASYYWLAPRDDLTATIAAAAWEQIRRYPHDRRPGRIAANLILDTGHQLRRAYPREPHQSTRAALSDPNPGAELLSLVCDAVQDGRLSRDDADLILRTRLKGDAISDIARRTGLKRNTIVRRRVRAEARLRDAA